MAIGLSVSILISLWVLNEFSYDKFYENSDNIYRVEPITDFRVAVTSMHIGSELKKKFSNIIEKSVRLTPYIGSHFFSNRWCYFQFIKVTRRMSSSTTS